MSEKPELKSVRGYRLPGEGSSFAISVATIIVLFVVWWIVTNLGLIKELFLPKPQSVATAFVKGWQGDVQGGEKLYVHFGWSMLRVLSSFLLAIVTAIPIGIMMGVSRIWRGIFDPPIEFYRPLPPLAYMPLLVIWFGIDETPKILLLFLACFAPLCMAARAGVRSVAVEQINAAASMGATKWQIVRHVVLPAALPEILTGLRIGMGVAWTTLVAAEMIAAQQGLGQMVLNASNFLRTDIVIMGIVVIGIVAYAMDLGMRWVERKLVPWKGRV
jgi:taurine transport system permease protein